MTNAYRVVAGKDVDYIDAIRRWRIAKVTAVTDQNNVVLAYVNSDGSRTAINGGVAVPRRSSRGSNSQTNVWRPY